MTAPHRDAILGTMPSTNALTFPSPNALTGENANHPGGFDMARLLCDICRQLGGADDLLPGEWNLKSGILGAVWCAFHKHGLHQIVGPATLHVFGADLKAAGVLPAHKTAIEIAGQFFSHHDLTTPAELEKEVQAQLRKNLPNAVRTGPLKHSKIECWHQINEDALKHLELARVLARAVDACVLEEKATTQAHILDRDSLAASGASIGRRL